MPKCRFCGAELKNKFADLNMAPIVNDYLSKERANKSEVYYPLVTYVCDECKLVQTLDFNASDEIFTEDYAYFSSYSTSWLEHCKRYVDMITERLNLTSESHVMEVASNDGYMLQYFKEKNISILGVEPCKSVADVAIMKGINTLVEFFGTEIGKVVPKADLICMCNVLAHVPDINDFVQGIKESLKPEGTVTIEFPHLLNIIKYNQFDTIYLEHYSYISLIFAIKLFEAHDMKIYDVEELPTHGGSLRIYGTHKSSKIEVLPNVQKVLDKEIEIGMDKVETYTKYHEQVKATKRSILSLLIDIKNQGKSIVAYGAAAKGNTLFNYCGIGTDLIDYSVDLNPHKQNTYLPGCHIPVYHPDKIKETKPDYIFIAPWNIKDEIVKQLEYTKSWGAKFIVAIPEAQVM
ncbi:class I SAM-dependent methyltransferase [bacterium]|nr:class I SAM-dependent methyltransferase [bacterium]